MARSAHACVLSVVLLLCSCAAELVELPGDREPAAPVPLAGSPVRCPADTVLLGDEDSGSGAGSVPAGFDARTVLRCEVDYRTARSRSGVERLTVRQWRAPATPQLLTALDLPDRGYRPAVACAASSSTSTAVYLVDTRRRAIRALLPYDDPCRVIRAEVLALLPPRDQPADATFRVTQEDR